MTWAQFGVREGHKFGCKKECRNWKEVGCMQLRPATAAYGAVKQRIDQRVRVNQMEM